MVYTSIPLREGKEKRKKKRERKKTLLGFSYLEYLCVMGMMGFVLPTVSIISK